MIAAFAGAGGALCALLLALMASKPKRALGDVWLLAWLAAYLFYFATLGLSLASAGWSAFALSLAAQSAAVALAPLQYLHGRAVTAAPLRESLAWAAPALIGMGAVWLLPVLAPLRFESGALVADAIPLWLAFLPPAALLATLAYPVAVLRELAAYRRRLKRRLSNLHVAGLSWARLWAVSTIGLILFQLAVFGISLSGFVPVAIHMSILLAAQSLQVAFVGYHGVTRTQIFHLARADEAERTADARDLTAARADFAHVERFIAERESYRDAELTAPALAEALGWGQDRLATALRLGGATNFHDLVNRARIAHVKRAAGQAENVREGLLALAFDAGFGSKSAFYEVFRSVEGMTPARWRKQNAPD